MRLRYLAASVAVALVAFGIVVLAGGYTHAAKPAAHPVPAAQPSYTQTFQGLLDAARPKGEPRIVVRGCVAGPTTNRHFCAWVANGECHAGMIVVTPGEGTVPESHGRAGVSVSRCSPVAVLRWLGSQVREGS